MKVFRNLVSYAAPLILFVFAAPNVSAQLPGAKLKLMFPPGGQVGTTFEVSLEGTDLNGAEGLSFSHAGLSGKPVVVDGDEFIKRPQWQRNRFKVSIAADVPPGIYEGWFVGRYGISNSVVFVVGDLPQPVEIGGNNSLESAKEIAFNSVAVGRCDAGKPDYFRVPLKAGQKVVVDCQAQRLGSRLDAVVAVLDPSGVEVARKGAGHGRDPVLAFTASADGAYAVAVSDFLSSGGSDRFFRLVVSDRPYIDAVFPPARQPGTKGEHQLYGKNLTADKIGREIEAGSGPAEVGGAFPFHSRELFSAGTNFRVANSNTVRIPFATAPVVIEDVDAEIQKVSVPCEIAGHVLPGDTDAFEFEAKKGDAWIIEAVSHRAGHATDLKFKIYRVVIDAEGKRSEQKVAEADDDANNAGGRRSPLNSRDPLLTFKAPEDGSYVVRLFDQFQLDDRHASYRLAIRRPVADFVLMASLEDPLVEGKRLDNWSPVLLRGGRVRVAVRAIRRDGFDAEIDLDVANPPAGVEVRGGNIKKGASYGSLMLCGAADLAKGISDLKVVGKSGDLERVAYGASMAREVGDYDNEQVLPRIDQSLRLALADRAAPISIAFEAPEIIQTSLGGTVELPLKISKGGVLKGATNFITDGIPNVAKPARVALDLNKVAEGKISIPIKPSNENKYTAGIFQLSVRGEGVLQYHPDPLAVAEATEDQKAVDPLVALAAETLKQGQAKKASIAQAGLTEDEKVKHTAAADEAIKQAQGGSKAAEEAKKRAAELLKQASDRNKPRDLKVAGFSRTVTLEILPAPLRFKAFSTTLEVARGATVEVPVELERLFGFADAVELSLLPPKDVPGFQLKPVSVPDGQAAGKLIATIQSDAPEGEHAFVLLGKMSFNGVNCELRRDLKLKVTAAAPATK